MKAFIITSTLFFTILTNHGRTQENIDLLKLLASEHYSNDAGHNELKSLRPNGDLMAVDTVPDIYWNPPKERNNSLLNTPNNFIRLPNGHTYSGSSEGIKMWDNYADIHISTENSNIPEDNVTALALDSNENLWIGTKSSGVVVGYGDPVKPFRTHAIVTRELNILSMYTDVQGCVWITYQSGGTECFRDGISIAYYPGK